MNKTLVRKLLMAGTAALAAITFAPATPAHADTECGYARPGVRVVALGPTTCPFALSVAQQMMNGAGTSFTAYSPVTGQSYFMHCMIEQHGSTTCRGGDDAGVQIF
jgi:hypothetical protein